MDKVASCDIRENQTQNQSTEGTESVWVHNTVLNIEVRFSKLRFVQAFCLSLSVPWPYRELSVEESYVSYENILHQKNSSKSKLKTKK